VPLCHTLPDVANYSGRTRSYAVAASYNDNGPE